MIEVYRSDNIVVRSLPAADTSRWVVTFDNYGIGHGFDRQGFGQEFLMASGISAIHVLGVREDWYQYPDMAEAMAAVRKVVAGAERVMTYGSSMGGYAALRFADWAGANAVLALSPQYSNNPELVPFENRWTQDAGRIHWLPELQLPLTCSGTPVVVYDPKIEDQQHADLIARDLRISAIRLPYTGHPATTSLAESGLLKSLVYQTLSGELDLTQFERQARQLRRQSSFYLANLARAQLPRRPMTALSLAEMARDLAPHSRLAVSGLGRIQSDIGLHKEAVETLAPVMDMPGDETLYYVQYADVLAAAGQFDKALFYAGKVVERLPDLAHLQAWKAHIHWQKGERDLALSMVRKAQVMDPLNEHFAVTIDAYETGMQAQQEAEAAALAAAETKRRPRSLLMRCLGRFYGRGNADAR